MERKLLTATPAEKTKALKAKSRLLTKTLLRPVKGNTDEKLLNIMRNVLNGPYYSQN